MQNKESEILGIRNPKSECKRGDVAVRNCPEKSMFSKSGTCETGTSVSDCLGGDLKVVNAECNSDPRCSKSGTEEVRDGLGNSRRVDSDSLSVKGKDAMCISDPQSLRSRTEESKKTLNDSLENDTDSVELEVMYAVCISDPMRLRSGTEEARDGLCDSFRDDTDANEVPSMDAKNISDLQDSRSGTEESGDSLCDRFRGNLDPTIVSKPSVEIFSVPGTDQGGQRDLSLNDESYTDVWDDLTMIDYDGLYDLTEMTMATDLMNITNKHNEADKDFQVLSTEVICGDYFVLSERTGIG